MLQAIKLLPRLGRQQNALVLAVRKILNPDAVRVAVTEVDTLALLRWDLGGQGYTRAWFFDAVFKSAQAVNVGAMRKHAPRVLFEPVPLFQKVIAAMVTDFLDHFAVRDANLRNVRREDNQFAAV